MCVCVCVCVCVCYLVYVYGALSQDGANSGGQAQLHQALQMSLGIRLRLISRLFQGAAVDQSETPARAQTHTQTHTLTLMRLSEMKMSAALFTCPAEPAMQTGASQTEALVLRRCQRGFAKWQSDLLILSLPVQKLENEVFKLSCGKTQIFVHLRGRKAEKIVRCNSITPSDLDSDFLLYFRLFSSKSYQEQFEDSGNILVW